MDFKFIYRLDVAIENEFRQNFWCLCIRQSILITFWSHFKCNKSSFSPFHQCPTQELSPWSNWQFVFNCSQCLLPYCCNLFLFSHLFIIVTLFNSVKSGIRLKKKKLNQELLMCKRELTFPKVISCMVLTQSLVDSKQDVIALLLLNDMMLHRTVGW